MKLATLQRLIERALEPPPACLRELCGDDYQPYYHLMFLLARQIRRGVAVELGVHIGRGVGSLAAGSQRVTVFGLDPANPPGLGRVLARYGNISFHQEAALPVPAWLSPGAKVNILHIDTEHSYANARQEFESYRAFLARGAAVLFDDLHAMDDGVLAYFNELAYPKVQEDRLHPVCGYGVVLYE